MTSLAPCSRQNASLSSVDAAAIPLAPSAAPSSQAATPTPPAAPSTSRVSPGWIAARSTSAWIVVRYVICVAAPTSKLTPSGSLTTAASAQTSLSTNVPLTWVSATRSPGATRVTPAPTSRTTPAHSAPGENGKVGLNWYIPRDSSTSGKFTPLARTSIRTWPAPTLGSGSSSIRRTDGPMSSWTRTARMPRLYSGRVRAEHAQVGCQRPDVIERGVERLAGRVAEHVGVEPVGERRLRDRARFQLGERQVAGRQPRKDLAEHSRPVGEREHQRGLGGDALGHRRGPQRDLDEPGRVARGRLDAAGDHAQPVAPGGGGARDRPERAVVGLGAPARAPRRIEVG